MVPLLERLALWEEASSSPSALAPDRSRGGLYSTLRPLLGRAFPSVSLGTQRYASPRLSSQVHLDPVSGMERPFVTW